MDKQEERICGYAAMFGAALTDVLKNDEYEYHVEVDEENATDVFTGMCIGFLSTLGRYTNGGKGNHLDNISMCNKIIVQYLMKFGKLE